MGPSSSGWQSWLWPGSALLSVSGQREPTDTDLTPSTFSNRMNPDAKMWPGSIAFHLWRPLWRCPEFQCSHWCSCPVCGTSGRWDNWSGYLTVLIGTRHRALPVGWFPVLRWTGTAELVDGRWMVLAFCFLPPMLQVTSKAVGHRARLPPNGDQRESPTH